MVAVARPGFRAAPAPGGISDRIGAQPSSAPRLSIVVLPFANLSNDPQQEYFADGISEDLTTDIAGIQGSQVIARNTAFTYKGKPVDAKQIGRDLGVRYVLEGSVQRSGKEVRVNAQLVDAETGAHLGPNGSTATSATCSRYKTRSRRGLPVSCNRNSRLRNPGGRPTTPTRWTI